MASAASAASKRKRAGVASPESAAQAAAAEETPKIQNGGPQPKRQRANSGRAVESQSDEDIADSG